MEVPPSRVAWSRGQAWFTARIVSVILLLGTPDAVVSLPSIQANGKAIEGGEVTLTCKLDPGQPTNPSSTFDWYRNGLALLGQSRAVLTLSDVRREDDGVYCCGYFHATLHGLVWLPSEDFTLTVLYSPRVYVEVEPGNEWSPPTFRPGDRVTLTCVVVDAEPSVPEDGYTWTFSKTSANVLDDVTSLATKTRTLRIESMYVTTSGVYTCAASNDPTLLPGTAEAEVAVFSKPVLRIDPSPNLNVYLNVEEGRKFALTCLVISARPPVPKNGFTWHFQPTDSEKFRTLEATTDTLILGPLEYAHTGRYACTARNDAELTFPMKTGVSHVDIRVHRKDMRIVGSFLGDITIAICLICLYACFMHWRRHEDDFPPEHDDVAEQL